MNKSFTSLLALALVATSGLALAESTTSPKAIQVAILNTQPPVMSHEVASLMQTMQKAQAQYRRSGQPQDLARVDAVRRERASCGFGKATQSAPVMVADSSSSIMTGEQIVQLNVAQ
jgi:hypothetical protein